MGLGSLDPRNAYKKAKKLAKKAERLTRHPFRRYVKQVKRHAKKDSWGALYKSYVAGQEEDAAQDLVNVEAGEKAVIAAEKLTTAKSKLEAQRKKRRSSAARKGRRASIMSGPLGAGSEPEVRRAGVLGMN